MKPDVHARGFFGSPLYPVVDAAVFGGADPSPVLRTLAAAGVRMAQLRAKTMPAGEFLSWASAGVRGTAGSGLRIIVNDRPDVALLAGAAGVHLGQADLSCGAARELLGPEALIGLSAHSPAQLRRAAQEPHDYLALGPIFPTRTKADAAPVVGLAGLKEARTRYPGPLAAIGGISAPRVRETLEAGADAVAVVSALKPADPAGRRGVRERAEALLAAAGERSARWS